MNSTLSRHLANEGKMTHSDSEQVLRRSFDRSHPKTKFSRSRSHKPVKRRRSRIKWTLERALSHTHTLIRPEAVEVFIANCRPVLLGWISLLQNTHLEKGVFPSAIKIKSVLSILNTIISNKGSANLPARFGYVRLVDFFECLEERVREQREIGKFVGESGRRNTTVAIQLCISALQDDFPASQIRSRLKEQKRVGVRWKWSNRESVFLLLIYSDRAEAIVKNKGAIDDKIVRCLGAAVLNGIPKQFIDVCTEMSKFAEEASASGNSDYIALMSEFESEVSRRLRVV